MIEVRTILAEEADEFLMLLCNVFTLDFKAAQNIFYQEPLFDLNRKWALFEDGKMTSILTTSPLEFGWGRAAGIAGVATKPEARGRGLARQLLSQAMEATKDRGEHAFMLFATDQRVYKKLGFTFADDVVRGEVKCSGQTGDLELLEVSDVKQRYSAWSAESDDRLIRTHLKWEAWTWSLKHCEARGDGYVCIEPVLLREAILPGHFGSWPLPENTIFYGLKRTAEAIGVPLLTSRVEMHAMTLGFPKPPIMFMTDQF